MNNNNKDEIRLDRPGSSTNEDNMPNENVTKTTASPSTNKSGGSPDNENLTQAGSPGLDSAPDFSNKETKDNTEGDDSAL